MRRIKFTKYHALGNDFIIIDGLKKKAHIRNWSEFARRICSRNFGIGADGILALTPSKKAFCRADVYNSDGSWAEKSGNGLRIVAAFIYSHHRRQKSIDIETASGVAKAEIINASGLGFSIRVSLGSPIFETRKIPMKSRAQFHINRPLNLKGKSLCLTALSVGNPHAVIFVEDFNFNWQELGRTLEYSAHFPRRTNVEFAKVTDSRKVALNDWERGAGATGSSGTGAAATVVAGVVNGLLERKAEVVFPSGSLWIEWRECDDNLYLTGPVKFICAGEFEL